MNELFAAIRQFLANLRPWVTVAPWEQALRVRAGKHVRLLRAGIHWKLPIIDVIFLQSVRLRISGFGRQTLTTRDSITITFSGSLGYTIADIQALYGSLHHSEDTLQCLARAKVAEYICTKDFNECRPSVIVEKVGTMLTAELAQYGLTDCSLYLSDYAVVRTYRIVGDYQGFQTFGASLNTDTPISRAP